MSDKPYSFYEVDSFARGITPERLREEWEQRNKMLLEEKMKRFETVGGGICIQCGNAWYFQLEHAYECTTCGHTTEGQDGTKERDGFQDGLSSTISENPEEHRVLPDPTTCDSG
jgi:hypothetical protein